MQKQPKRISLSAVIRCTFSLGTALMVDVHTVYIEDDLLVRLERSRMLSFFLWGCIFIYI